MLSIQLQGGLPISDQLEKHFTTLIVDGAIVPDEKLPAVREIARELTINPNTVQKVYNRLEQKGLIYSIPSKGSYASKREQYSVLLMENAEGVLYEAIENAYKAGVAYDSVMNIVGTVYENKNI